MTQLSKLIEEIIEEKISDFLPGKHNSAAAQAKQQGLSSIGFGRWANARGEYVAKTVNGRLQAIDTVNRRTQPKDRNPSTMPLNRGVSQGGGTRTAADPADMKDKVAMATRKKLSTAFKSPEVKRAAEKGYEMTGDQMTRLTGLPEKAFRLTSYSLDGGNTNSVWIDDTRALDYDKKTDRYKFREEI
jgi:hypothetical protein